MAAIGEHHQGCDDRLNPPCGPALTVMALPPGSNIPAPGVPIIVITLSIVSAP